MNIVFIRKNLISKPSDIKKRAFDSFLARVVAKFSAIHFYGMQSPVILEEKKPRFVQENVYFSISHSNDIVAVAIDDCDIGFDIEYMKNRNFEEISKHLKWSNLNSKQDFYREWTKYEAQIKQKSTNIQSFLFENYSFSLSSNSDKNIKKIVKMFEIKIPDNRKQVLNPNTQDCYKEIDFFIEDKTDLITCLEN